MIFDENYDFDKETWKDIEFLKHFNMHYSLLLRRYERFKKINRIDNADIDVITYLDMIVVQIRAMCIESPQLNRNYTAQNLLRKVGEGDKADRIDAMLQERFMEIFDKTIRDAIKLLADKFICHYDSFDENISNANNEFRWAERVEKQLRSPYEEHNLDYIMGTLISCIGDSSIIKVNFESEE